MEKIVCIGGRSWQRLLERVEYLSALAQRLEGRLVPPQDDGRLDGEEVCRAPNITKRTL